VGTIQGDLIETCWAQKWMLCNLLAQCPPRVQHVGNKDMKDNKKFRRWHMPHVVRNGGDCSK